MARDPTNIAASVRDRLRNMAQKDGIDFQFLLTRYVLERLLYRLSVSASRDEFVLKGAMLYALWLEDPFRNTRDLDLAARSEHDATQAAKLFREILAANVPDDGVTFETGELRAEPIRENASYGGIRITTVAHLSGARVPVRIDIGFGDAITPKPAIVEYPALLDHPRPRLMAYPRETVVAEKFEAMVALGLTNSRMKDFHDIAVLAKYFDFEGPALTGAIAATFKRRGTTIPAEAPLAFSVAFTRRPETAALWKAFVVREAIAESFSDLDAIVGFLRLFLLDPAVAAANEKEFNHHWPAGGPWKMKG